MKSATRQGSGVIEEFSYDPWGRRRNPDDWNDYDVTEPTLFTRGYTGHEHIGAYSLINMNGRMYDPRLGRFLSPDPYVQAPGYSQSFNRYSYVWNNPLKYTDPSGYQVNGSFPYTVYGGYVMKYWEISTYEHMVRYEAQNAERNQYNYQGYYSSLMLLAQRIASDEENRRIRQEIGLNTLAGLKKLFDAFFEFENENAQTGKNNYDNKPSSFWIGYANYLHYLSRLFKGAVAVYYGVSGDFVGAERGTGYYFIIAGMDIGRFEGAHELAGGAGSGAGVGVEIGRVDVFGIKSRDFRAEMLQGHRQKIFGGAFGVGAEYSWSYPEIGIKLTTRILKIGLSVSPFGGPVGGGYNQGEIWFWKR